MKAVWAELDRMLQSAGQACLISIASVRGSAPRAMGTRMLVRADGAYAGTIGGGALEWQALAEAHELLRKAPDGGTCERLFALGPSLGQCCGGEVRLRFEAFVAADRDWIAPLVHQETAGAFQTLGERDSRGVLIRKIAPEGGSGGIREDFGETAQPVALFGAGHVGRALVLAAAPLPFAIRWIDSREEAFPPAHPANVTPILSPAPLTEIAHLAAGTLVVIMTHDHALDLGLAAAALGRDDLPFVGVIGSATKAARFSARLTQLGLASAASRRFISPIGISSLSSKVPAIIAAGIVVQLLGEAEALTAARLGPTRLRIRQRLDPPALASLPRAPAHAP